MLICFQFSISLSRKDNMNILLTKTFLKLITVMLDGCRIYFGTTLKLQLI